MGILRHFLFVLAVCWFSFTLDAEAKTLYVCDDGRTVLLTDRAELGCQVYKPKAELFTVPDGGTWADVKAAVAAVESEAFQPQAKSSKTMRTKEAREDRCRWWSVIGSSLTDECDGDVPSSGLAQGLSVKKAQEEGGMGDLQACERGIDVIRNNHKPEGFHAVGG